MGDRVRALVDEKRKLLPEDDRDSAPKIVHGLIEATDSIYREDRPVLDVVLGAGWNGIVRAALKKPHGAIPHAQLMLWPEAQREHVQAVQNTSVFVPSRGAFVALVPGGITAQEVVEAAQFLRTRGIETIRRAEALMRLSDTMLKDVGSAP